MYKIGEFSKITQLTVKALHYYDEENLLSPSYRNEENGYRFYSEEDFEKAKLISALREMNFSIAEIREMIKGYEEGDLQYFFKEKKEMLEKQIQQQKQMIRKLEALYMPEIEGANRLSKNHYEMTLKTIPCVRVVSKRYKGKYQDVGQHIGDLYKAIKGRGMGEIFNCYYDSDYQELADIELCIPIQRQTKVDIKKDMEVKELPTISAISVIHHGPYEQLNLAYKSVIDYARNQKVQCLLPSREIYHKGPGMIFKGNPNKYVTEILIPIDK